MTPLDLTVAIPTYRRGAILVTTLERLLSLEDAPTAIVVVDQTEKHPMAVEEQLREWEMAGSIVWIRLDRPSIPRAMNRALLESTTALILFLDDDVVPSNGLIAAHSGCFDDAMIWASVGQILQPGQSPETHPRPIDDLEFRFNHDQPELIANVMAGNLCVRKKAALRIGGFDERYSGAAYRFESDFALRMVEAGGSIRFEPRATLRHLQLSSGGLRSYGDHRSSPSPAHSAGDYYFALTHRPRPLAYAIQRLRRNVCTRWHLRHPWAIAPKLVGELRGFLTALKMARRGPQLLPKRE